jgi:DNA-binding LacI/PurR family transcriptional regulator
MAHIAQAVGVAGSTVSRALQGDPRIGEETRRKIRETAERLGYRPNPLVSALMANRRRRGGRGEVDVVALVTNYGAKEDWRTKEVCRWEFEGVQRRAAELGFRLEIFSLRAYGGDIARLVSTLRARGIRGVLLGFAREAGDEPIFPTEGFAVAGLSAYFRTTVVDRANFHGFFNVQLALEKIAGLGYRRPALAVPEPNNRISNNLWSGAFLDWQRRLPRKDRCEPFIPSDGEDADEFHSWLVATKPDSVLAYKLPIRAWLARRGLGAPEDVGLAYLYRTADEMGACAGIDGNLSAVGAAAFDLVVERLNTNATGPVLHPKEVLIKGFWRDGATLPESLPCPTKAAAGRSPRKASALVRL